MLFPWQSVVVPTASLLLGAAITYIVQRRLEDAKRRKAQQHLAYALLVQVSDAAARHDYLRTQLEAGAAVLAKEGIRVNDKFDSSDFWCALLGDLLRKDEGMGDLLSSYGPSLNSMSDYLSVTLSGLTIKGRDLAELPKEVLSAHQLAATSLYAVKQSVDLIAATVRTDRSKLRDDQIRLAWSEMQKMSKSLAQLRERLQIAAGTSRQEVAALHEEAVQNLKLDVAETARRAQALPLAADEVKSFLAARRPHIDQ
jgi:hypothetical protein